MAHKNRDMQPSPSSSSQTRPRLKYTYPPTPSASGSRPMVVPMDTDADPKLSIFKGPKRKRLVKACDACHKSKRRCDGTAPCGNCYFASKECTYTDAAGRPVPAPNAIRHAPINGVFGLGQVSQLPSTSGPVPSGTPRVITPRFIFDDGKESSTQPSSRKRPRDDHINHAVDLSTATALSTGARPQPVAITETRPSTFSTLDGYEGMDRQYMRILVNLFFTHCHPHRLMIHAPTFLSELSFDRIPPYLINAICALAAPISRTLRGREAQVRHAGQPFANVALDALFDADRNLVAPFSLATAQTLCLLQAHKTFVDGAMDGDFQFFGLAMKILSDLEVYKTDTPIFTSVPSLEMRQKSIERECMRRTVWYMHLIELLGSIFVHRPVSFKFQEDSFRLPCDETTFELAPHMSVPEYLSINSPKRLNASEFGHVIRVARILCDIEKQNVEAPGLQSVTDCENKLSAWASTVAEHLRFTPENLREQLELWESGSNTSAWCYGFMHVLHAACVVSLSDIRMRLGLSPHKDEHAASNAVSAIIEGLGHRARNSILMGVVLWFEYCGPHAPHLRPRRSSEPQHPDDLAAGNPLGSGSERGVSNPGAGIGGGGSGGGGGMPGSISTVGNSAPSGVGGEEGAGSTSSVSIAAGLVGAPAAGGCAGSSTLTGRTSGIRTWIPDLKLDDLVKEWEELWGPVKIHHNPGAADGIGAVHQQTKQQVQVHWTIHEGVIDPALRGSGRMTGTHLPSAPPPSHPAPPQAVLSLPSLKSSGLLDVGSGSAERDRASSVSGSRGTWTRTSTSTSGDVGVSTSSAPTALSPSGLAIPAPPSGVVVPGLSGPGSIVGPGMAGPMPMATSTHRGGTGSAPTTPSETSVGGGGYPARVYTHTQTHTHTSTYFMDHPYVSPTTATTAAMVTMTASGSGSGSSGSGFRSSPPRVVATTSPRSQRSSRAPPPPPPLSSGVAQPPTSSPAPGVPPPRPGSTNGNGNEPVSGAVPSAQRPSSSVRR